MRMPIFMSYSRSDEEAVKTMVRAFEAAHREVWFDHDLRGGEMWWEMILRNIRAASVFLFAMSDHSLASKACRAELEYADALGRPILPVQVGPVSAERWHILAGRQCVTFRQDDAVAGFEVLDAADTAAKLNVPLPDPLPIEPPIPFAYLGAIRRQIEGGELINSAQLELISQLRRSLGEETDASTRRGILRMLETLRDRPWRTMQAGLEIHAVLIAYEAIERDQAGAPTRPIEVPLGVEVPKPTPEWTEDEAREAFLRRIDEVVGELEAGKACRQARRTDDSPAFEALPGNGAPDRPDDGPSRFSGADSGRRNAPRYFAGVCVGSGDASTDVFPGPTDPPGLPPASLRSDPAVTSPTTRFPGVRQGPSAAQDYPADPAAPPYTREQRPPVEPDAEAVGPPRASARPAPPSTARGLAVAAIVVCGVFAVFVAGIGRATAAGTFALPAVVAIVALIFSAQVRRRMSAGNLTGARRAFTLTKIWSIVALVVAVAALAVALNYATVTG